MACADMCSICTDPFHSLDTVAYITCGHTFHDVCIRNWMERSNLCPICRSYYSDIKKVYLNFDANVDGEVRNNDLKLQLQEAKNTIKALLQKNDERDKQYRDLEEQYNLSESNFLNLHKQYTELDEYCKNVNKWLTEVHDVPSQTVELRRNAQPLFGQKASIGTKDNVSLQLTFKAVNKHDIFGNSSAVASTSGVNRMRTNNIFSLSPKGTTTASKPYPFNFGALSSFHKPPTNPQIPFGFLNPISTENDTHSNNALVSSQSSPYAPIKNTHSTANAVTPSSTTGITTQSPSANIENLFTSASCRSLAKPNLTVLNEPFPSFNENRESTSKEPTASFESSEKNETVSIFAALNLNHMNSITINSQKSPFGTRDSAPTNNENLSNIIFRFGCSSNSATSDPTLEVKSTTNPTTLSNWSTVVASNTTNSAIYSNSMFVNGENGPADRITDTTVTENTVIASTSNSAVIASSTIDTGIEWRNNAFIFGGEENTKNISENPTASFGSFPFFGQAKDPMGSTLPKAENFTDHFAKPTINSNKLKTSAKKEIRKLQRNPIQDSKTRFLKSDFNFTTAATILQNQLRMEPKADAPIAGSGNCKDQ